MKSSSSPFFNAQDAITDRFSLLHRTNRPPWTSASSSFSRSQKRPSYENPSSHLPNSKKPKNNADNGNFLVGFTKIPLSAPPLEPSVGRFKSDPYSPPVRPLVEEPPYFPTPKSKIECPGTPAKLPPPRRFPAKTFSGSCGCPNPEWPRKMGNCTREMSRKWDKVLGYGEHTENAEMNWTTDYDHGDNNRNIEGTMIVTFFHPSILENSQEASIETVSVEKKGETNVIDIKCPCCAEFQLLLVEGNCYYKLL